MSDKYREPAKHDAFRLGEQPEAPVERGLQRLLARRRRARALPPQRQMLIEKLRGLRQAAGLDPASRQFHGERHAVKPSADAGDDVCVRIADIENGAAGRCRSMNNCGAGNDKIVSAVISGSSGGQAEGIQLVDAFTLDAQGLAARRQDMDLRRSRR